MAAPRDIVTGTVSKVNGTGFQLQDQPDVWYTISDFSDPRPELPRRGARVRVEADAKRFVYAVDAVQLTETVAPAPAAAGAPGAVLSTRLACLQAAAAYLAPRTEAKYTDVLKVAQAFEEWVTR